MNIPFELTFAELPARFFARVQPAPSPKPKLIKLNQELATALGLNLSGQSEDEAAAMFSGQQLKAGEGLAMAYAGHQFGNFVPQLGDGRAMLLGEIVAPDGVRYDLQLKGAGPTPFSRRGDGRAALGPVLREYVVSEAMAALGIPTTRALAAVTTGDVVYREEGAIAGAILTRVARSHIRVGTFEFFAARQDHEGMEALVRYVIGRHYPDAQQAERPARALLDAVIAAQASLIAQWMHVGFIHGVMNTDNMAVSGETIDYGPCAFMDEFDPGTVFSFIDQHGRYAYGNQPRIAKWNLARLAECLLPLLADSEDAGIQLAGDALARFDVMFEEAYMAQQRRKLGLAQAEPQDAVLGQELLKAMAASHADFTNTHRALCDAANGSEGEQALRAQFADPTALDRWLPKWRARLQQHPSPGRTADMKKANPAIIPRNHLVEAVIRAAVDRQDFVPFHELVSAVSQPFKDQAPGSVLTLPPRPTERIENTFCGT